MVSWFFGTEKFFSHRPNFFFVTAPAALTVVRGVGAWTARNGRDPPGGSRTVTQTASVASSGMTVKCEFGAAAVLVATSFLGKAAVVPHIGTAHLTAVVMPKHLRHDQMPVDNTGATGPFAPKVVIWAEFGKWFKYKSGASPLRRRGHRTH